MLRKLKKYWKLKVKSAKFSFKKTPPSGGVFLLAAAGADRISTPIAGAGALIVWVAAVGAFHILIADFRLQISD